MAVLLSTVYVSVEPSSKRSVSDPLLTRSTIPTEKTYCSLARITVSAWAGVDAACTGAVGTLPTASSISAASSTHHRPRLEPDRTRRRAGSAAVLLFMVVILNAERAPTRALKVAVSGGSRPAHLSMRRGRDTRRSNWRCHRRFGNRH